MDEPKTLRVSAELKNLAGIRSFIEAVAAAYRADDRATGDLLLAVDEAVTNSIVHGYAGRPGTIEIEVRKEGDALVVRLRDDAQPFNPTTVPTPDLSLPLDQRPIGGLGVHLMRESMDELIYRETPQGGNELTLVKKARHHDAEQGKEESDGDRS